MKNVFEINKGPGSGAGRWFGLVGLILIAATLWAASGHLQSGVPFPDNRSGMYRASWYVRSGQWRADIRTLVAVVSYVMDQDKVQPETVPAVVAQMPEPVISPPCI